MDRVIRWIDWCYQIWGYYWWWWWWWCWWWYLLMLSSINNITITFIIQFIYLTLFVSIYLCIYQSFCSPHCSKETCCLCNEPSHRPLNCNEGEWVTELMYDDDDDDYDSCDNSDRYPYHLWSSSPSTFTSSSLSSSSIFYIIILWSTSSPSSLNSWKEGCHEQETDCGRGDDEGESEGVL